MDILEKKIEIMELYDIYQNLLTEKQKQYIFNKEINICINFFKIVPLHTKIST